MEANNTASAKFLGTTDERTSCDCCGRTELKRTVVLQLRDDAEPVYFGVVCASRRLAMPAKQVRSNAAAADKAKRDEAHRAWRSEWDAKQAAQHAAWEVFLQNEGRGADAAERIASLGGFQQAYKRYEDAQFGA